MRSIREWTPYGVGIVATLLFVDLFLGWHHASVSVAGNLVAVEADSSAWSGWGAAAGVTLIVLLFWESLRLFGTAIARPAAPVLVFVFAVIAAAFTVIEFAAGTASVTSGLVVVDVHGRQWPSYVGLVLAVLLVVSAGAQLDRPDPRHSGRVGLGVR